MKKGLFHGEIPIFSAQQVAALRLSLAFLALLPFAIYYLPRTNRKKIFPIAMVGLFGNGIPAFLFTAAEEKLDSALAGVLNATTPVFAVVLGITFFRIRLKWLNYLGVAIGFAGACVAMLANGTNQFSADLWYAGLILIATTCYALSINLVRYYLREVHPMAVTSIAFFMIGIPATFWAFKCGSVQTLQHHAWGWNAFGYIAILGLVGTAFAVLIFNYLVRMTNAVYASTVTYLMPITSILWGLYFNEIINIWHVLGIGVILAGVYLSTRK